jgi:NADH oxidase (H2O2-forming)
MIADTAVGVAGLTKKAARNLGFDLVIGEAAAVDRHPGTMPCARELRVKLFFDQSSARLIGGEACGGVIAGKIANVMAQAIAGEMTWDEMAAAQIGTHPSLTASPLVYQIVNAAKEALTKLQ